MDIFIHPVIHPLMFVPPPPFTSIAGWANLNCPMHSRLLISGVKLAGQQAWLVIRVMRRSHSDNAVARAGVSVNSKNDMRRPATATIATSATSLRFAPPLPKNCTPSILLRLWLTTWWLAKGRKPDLSCISEGSVPELQKRPFKP